MQHGMMMTMMMMRVSLNNFVGFGSADACSVASIGNEIRGTTDSQKEGIATK
jgi:hypothetical protein